MQPYINLLDNKCQMFQLDNKCQMFQFSLWPLGVSNIKIRQSIKLHKSSLARSTRTLGILRIYMCLKKSQIYFLYSLNLKSSVEFFKLTIEVHDTGTMKYKFWTTNFGLQWKFTPILFLLSCTASLKYQQYLIIE